jgi:glycosyltransferase involved in cell wall biosynthesis
MAIAEAYACGVPVIAAGHGGLAEIVRDGFTGLHFEPGNAASLAAKVEWAWAHPQEMETMGRGARAEFEMKYTSDAALKHLESVYESVFPEHARTAAASVTFAPKESRTLAEPQKGAD